MTILSDDDIAEHVRRGDIAINPYNEKQLQPSSYDVCLGSYFTIFDMQSSPVIDPLDQTDHTISVGPVNEFILHPQQFALAVTAECFTLPHNMVGHLDGKSSLGRLGLIVHATAGYFDPGWHGNGTLELANVAPKPIVLRAGMLIGQMNFQMLTGRAGRSYGSGEVNSKYHDISGVAKPVSSRYWRNYPDGVVPPLTQPGEHHGAVREADSAGDR